MKIKCFKCKYFSENIKSEFLRKRQPKDVWFCWKLRHQLENGYALVYHSNFCGE
jgi:hypothetical protein